MSQRESVPEHCGLIKTGRNDGRNIVRNDKVLATFTTFSHTGKMMATGVRVRDAVRVRVKAKLTFTTQSEEEKTSPEGDVSLGRINGQRLSLNRSQYGGCSTKYNTSAGIQVVYRRF